MLAECALCSLKRKVTGSSNIVIRLTCHREMPQICRPGTNVDKDSEKKEPPKPEKVMTEKDKFKLDLIKCVYWTCLQLETYVHHCAGRFALTH
jgi:hypothetical protein